MGSTYEFDLSFPREPRYLHMLRDVVLSVAKQAGCGDAKATHFAQQVEDVVNGTPPDSGARVTVFVRQAEGRAEVRLGEGTGAQALSVTA